MTPPPHTLAEVDARLRVHAHHLHRARRMAWRGTSKHVADLRGWIDELLDVRCALVGAEVAALEADWAGSWPGTAADQEVAR